MRLTFFISLLSFSILAACSAPNTSSNPYGVWIGKLITDEGECPTDEYSILKIRGKGLIFNPGLGSSVLKGDYQKGQQTYHAELIDKGINNIPYRQIFEGYPVGRGIGGTLTTPRCHAHITLVRR